MSLLKGSFILTLLLSTCYTQHCNNYTISDATAFLNANVPVGDNTNADVTITRWIINCLATSGQPNKWHWVTFTANVTRKNGEILQAKGDVRCIDTQSGDQWDTTGSYHGINVASFNTSINTPTRMDCFRCLGNVGGDPVTHCGICDSSCNEGNRYCTGTSSGDCCNYFSTQNSCVSQCGTNQHSNETNFCQCDTFYTGSDCSVCSIQCSNGGVRNSSTCSCDCQSTGYNGSTCTDDINECTRPVNPCANGGTCNNINGSYTCTCVPGYSGDNCSIDINECDSNPCNNRGQCNDEVNAYTCTCIPGYTGTNCDVDINECQSSPCQHEGTCREDGINSYACSCTSGYTGTDCETNINECITTPPCTNGGTCTDTDGSFTCTCQGGWTGVLCQTCNVSNECIRPVCDGADTSCEQCMTGYSLVNGSCVTCNVKDCRVCTSKDTCAVCDNNLSPSDSGSTCEPPIIVTEPPPTRGRGTGINSGAIIGIVAAFIIVLLIIVIVIAVVIVILGKINKEKPPTYNVKTPKTDDKDIILTKISNI